MRSYCLSVVIPFMIDSRSGAKQKLMEEDRLSTQTPEVMDRQVNHKGLSPRTEGDKYEDPTVNMWGYLGFTTIKVDHGGSTPFMRDPRPSSRDTHLTQIDHDTFNLLPQGLTTQHKCQPESLPLKPRCTSYPATRGTWSSSRTIPSCCWTRMGRGR